MFRKKFHDKTLPKTMSKVDKDFIKEFFIENPAETDKMMPIRAPETVIFESGKDTNLNRFLSNLLWFQSIWNHWYQR